MNTRTDMAHEALRRCPELAGVEEENESKVEQVIVFKVHSYTSYTYDDK